MRHVPVRDRLLDFLWVPHAFLGHRFRQEDVDRLYLAERHAMRRRRRAVWLHPVASGGHHPFAAMT